jgi:hypothetical protein
VHKKCLVPKSKVIKIEPCYLKGCSINNLFMRFLDRVKYIRMGEEYFTLFNQIGYVVNPIKKHSQMCIYNKLFFTAEVIE